MSRAPAAFAVALVVALSGVACTSAQAPTAGARFRQPSSLAVFRGKTLADPTAIRPYLVVANQSRNDLSILGGVDDVPVAAPVKLRTLVLTVEDRPALVAAASLGDGPTPGSVEDPKDPSTAQPDLLVAVSGGDSVLQLVETWDTANLVHADPLESPTAFAVDLGYDVVALAVVPSAPGTARIAAVLADHRVAVVTYARGAGQSIAPVSKVVSDPLPFQPLAVAAMPGDPAETSLFAATLDPVATDGSGNPVYGVEEISISATALLPVRALGARAPTRLVAAARIQERIAGADGSGNPLPGSAANDEKAFANQTVVPRVYAVLDESGCGPRKPIDCGIVTLDAGPSIASGTVAIPHDDEFMPYRAPMRVPGRPLGLSVAGPPAIPPPAVSGEPDFTATAAGYMRLYSETVARATTAVAAVPSDDGYVYFLDLGRFETATQTLVVSGKPVSAAMPAYTRPSTCTATEDRTKPECAGRRLWLKDANGAFLATSVGVTGTDAIAMTPGYSPDEQWTISYQGLLSSDLVSRVGEAGEAAPGVPWLALQVGAGGGTFTDVVRLWDPALGVAPGDILVIKARAVGCVGTATGTSDPYNQFEVEVDTLLPPDVAYPGGAVTLRHRTTGEDPAWAACYDALAAQTDAGSTVTGLLVTARAGGYVVTGKTAAVSGSLRVDAGYVGRPQKNVPFTLAYQDEDALAAACPFDTWDGTLPAPACDATCRAACEQLAIVRKVRRYQGVSADCATNPASTSTCDLAWPGNKFPLVPAPVAVGFTFDVQRDPADPADPADPTVGTTPLRDLRLPVITTGNVTLLRAIGQSTSPYQASDVTAFDRSPWTDPVSGYRYLLSYPADFVLDTTPSQSGAPSTVVR